MYLNKLLLKEFGQFYNREINLKPGMNLVYSSQKSDEKGLKAFVHDMFYGASGQESRQSGKVYIKKDGKSYLVERSSQKWSQKTSVLDVQSGREVRLSRPDTLHGTLTRVSERDFNSMCLNASLQQERAEAQGTVQGVIQNFLDTGTVDMNREKAIAHLKAERKKFDPKPLIRRLDVLSAKIDTYDTVDDDIDAVGKELSQLDEDFAMEAAKRKRVARKLVENEDGSISYEADADLDEKLNKLTETGQGMLRDEEEDAPVKLTDRIPVILATGVLVVLVIAAIVYMMPFEAAIRKLFVIFTAIFVVFTIIDGLRAKGYFAMEDISTPSEEDFQKVLAEIEEENEEREALEFDMTFAREYAAKKAELKGKERRLLENRTERNRLRAEFNAVFKKKSALEEEIRSINLAIATISRLSDDFREKQNHKLLPNLGEMAARMTNGRFQSIQVDENRNIWLETGGQYASLDMVSDEDMAELAMAVKLAVAKCLYRDQVPLIVELGDLNDTQLTGLLSCVELFEAEQVLLVSHNRQTEAALKAAGLEVSCAEL
jgi:hypothetical protein